MKKEKRKIKASPTTNLGKCQGSGYRLLTTGSRDS